MGTRPPSSLESLLGRPPRSLRVDDRDERAERLRSRRREPVPRPARDPRARREPASRLGLAARPPAAFPSPRFGDYSRTRFESRVAFGGPDEGEDAEDELIATPTRQFSLLEITSGLPDDSREADEKQKERRLRDLRGRVKAARAVVSRTPELAEILANDWQKVAAFYARFEVT